ncbi:MAG: peptide deformylase [Pseudomonadota bacterium]|nr:peptide deformylase [Pseudomonadota bacterium]
MAILQVLYHPDPRLRIKAALVAVVDDEIWRLAADMMETMYAAPGIGLAATQVNVHRRLLVVDVSETHDQPLCLINPTLLQKDGVERMEEGCLSVPGVFEEVERAERIRIRFQDLEGRTVEQDADGLLAVCIQHEIDHLEGKLFLDYLSPLKRSRITKKLTKAQKQAL